jgi:hypothetical protein
MKVSLLITQQLSPWTIIQEMKLKQEEGERDQFRYNLITRAPDLYRAS